MGKKLTRKQLTIALEGWDLWLEIDKVEKHIKVKIAGGYIQIEFPLASGEEIIREALAEILMEIQKDSLWSDKEGIHLDDHGLVVGWKHVLLSIERLSRYGNS